jgi:hypothetical protein
MCVAGEKVLMFFFPPKNSEMRLGRWWPPSHSRGKTAIIDSYTRNLNNFTKKKEVTFAVSTEKNRRNEKQIISDEKKLSQKKSLL